MTFTMTEIVLLCWAGVATGLWMDSRKDLKFHRDMTSELLKRIARGKLKVVDTGESLEIKEVG